MSITQIARAGALMVASALLLSTTAEAAKLSIDEAVELSQHTGRPIFAIAGDSG